MRARSTAWMAAACLALVAGGERAGRAGPKEGEVSIGKVVTLESKVLGETRPLLVHLPSGYDLSTDRFPTLYLLDGKENFDQVAGMVRFLGDAGAIPRMIVVGVVNTDRARDFTPTHLERDNGHDVSTSGGAAQFLAFLERELIPWVDRSYRTQPYRVLAGGCLTGMFAIHTLVTHGDLFDAYLASGPYLNWDGQVVLRDLETRLKGLGARGRPRFLHATYSTDADSRGFFIDRDGRALEQALRRGAPARLSWRVELLEGEDHDTSNPMSFYRGLRLLYQDFEPSADLDLAALEKHYQKLGQRYGYPIAVPEVTVNLMGYRALLEQKDTARAIAIFERNVALHPESANVYDSLGEGYEAAGRLAEALESYRVGLARLRGQKKPDPRVLAVYEEHVARAEKALAGAAPAAGKPGKPR